MYINNYEQKLLSCLERPPTLISVCRLHMTRSRLCLLIVKYIIEDKLQRCWMTGNYKVSKLTEEILSKNGSTGRSSWTRKRITLLMMHYMPVLSKSWRRWRIARTGDAEWLVELLSSHPELVSSTDSNKNTPLHFSSANGHNGMESFENALNA